VAEHFEQLVVVALDVEDCDRLPVVSDVPPAPHLEKLFHRADAARQRDEGIGFFLHEGLPLMHVFHHKELGELLLFDEFEEPLWNYADDLPSGAQGCFGHSAHQTDISSAVDEDHAPCSQRLP
jgi:hypothetical protein